MRNHHAPHRPAPIDLRPLAVSGGDSWRGEASLFTWLCQIARNEITDYWRRRALQDKAEVFVEDDPSIAAALLARARGHALAPAGCICALGR